MNYVVEMGSGVIMIYTPSIIKIGSGIDRWGIHMQT
jgi:hypothetical protein